MSVYNLKPRFQNLLRPLCKKLVAHGVTANHITLLALGLSIVYGVVLIFVGSWWWLGFPLFMLFRMALNALDGMMAREHNQQSKLGMVLNELGDVLADVVLFLPFTHIIGDVMLLFIFSAIMTEFCGILAYMVYGTRTYHGPMGKSDRAVVTSILAILMIVLLWLKVETFYALSFFTMIILSVLCLITCYRRLKKP